MPKFELNNIETEKQKQRVGHTKIINKLAPYALAYGLAMTSIFTIRSYMSKRQEQELPVHTHWKQISSMSLEELAYYGLGNYGYDKIEINIVDENHNYIPGATYQVKDEEGETVSVFTSTTGPNFLSNIEIGKKYTIQEIATAVGYERDYNIYTFVPMKMDIISEKDCTIINFVTITKQLKKEIVEDDIVEDYLKYFINLPYEDLTPKQTKSKTLVHKK